MERKPNVCMTILCYWKKHKSIAYVELEPGLTKDENNNYEGAIWFELSLEDTYKKLNFQYVIRAPFKEYKVKSAINRVKCGLQEHNIEILRAIGENQFIEQYPDYAELLEYGKQVVEEEQKGELA